MLGPPPRREKPASARSWRSIAEPLESRSRRLGERILRRARRDSLKQSPRLVRADGFEHFDGPQYAQAVGRRDLSLDAVEQLLHAAAHFHRRFAAQDRFERLLGELVQSLELLHRGAA